MGKLIDANKEEFEKVISSEEGVIVVDFWAEWCGPCRMLGPVLKDISEEMEDVTVVKVNVEEGENGKFAAEMGVRGIPAVYLYKGSEQVDKFVGNKSKAAVIEIIEKHLEPTEETQEDESK